jgi:hypothetical protein
MTWGQPKSRRPPEPSRNLAGEVEHLQEAVSKIWAALYSAGIEPDQAGEWRAGFRVCKNEGCHVMVGKRGSEFPLTCSVKCNEEFYSRQEALRWAAKNPDEVVKCWERCRATLLKGKK